MKQIIAQAIGARIIAPLCSFGRTKMRTKAKRPRARQATPKRPIWLLVGAGILVVLIISVVSLFASINRIRYPYKCNSPNCYNNPSGPSVSWATQVAVAQQEIAKIDRSAVLHEVSALPVVIFSPNWAYTKTLTVEFRYVSPSGNSISITMQDTFPTSTVKTTQERTLSNEFYNRYAPNQANNWSRIANMKLSPREAGERT